MENDDWPSKIGVKVVTPVGGLPERSVPGGHVVLGRVPGIDLDVDDATAGDGRPDAAKGETLEGRLPEGERALLLGSRSSLCALGLVFGREGPERMEKQDAQNSNAQGGVFHAGDDSAPIALTHAPG